MTSPTHIGVLNPIRYRGHYYDTETGYYYLQSRYYDPEIGRFINADVLTDTEQGLFSHNMYAYCENNPINSADPSGELLISACVLIGIGVGALIGGAIGSVAGYNTAKRLNIPSEDRWKFVAGYGLGGSIIGGVIGGFMGYGVALGCLLYTSIPLAFMVSVESPTFCKVAIFSARVAFCSKNCDKRESAFSSS